MSYVKCNVCPTHPECVEAGACLNTLVTHRYQAIQLATLRGTPAPQAATPAPMPQAAAQAPRQPSQRPPAGGSVTQAIYAACDAALAELRAADPSKWGSPAALTQARAVAIPRLEAQGVNSNSARKGSSMWLQAQKEVANQQ